MQITGTNLLLAAAENATTAVSVGGVQAPQVTLPGLPDTIDFTVPAPATGAWPPETAQQVAVTTTADAIATLNGTADDRRRSATNNTCHAAAAKEGRPSQRGRFSPTGTRDDI